MTQQIIDHLIQNTNIAKSFNKVKTNKNFFSLITSYQFKKKKHNYVYSAIIL